MSRDECHRQDAPPRGEPDKAGQLIQGAKERDPKSEAYKAFSLKALQPPGAAKGHPVPPDRHAIADPAAGRLRPEEPLSWLREPGVPEGPTRQDRQSQNDKNGS